MLQGPVGHHVFTPNTQVGIGPIDHLCVCATLGRGATGVPSGVCDAGGSGAEMVESPERPGEVFTSAKSLEKLSARTMDLVLHLSGRHFGKVEMVHGVAADFVATSLQSLKLTPAKSGLVDSLLATEEGTGGRDALAPHKGRGHKKATAHPVPFQYQCGARTTREAVIETEAYVWTIDRTFENTPDSLGVANELTRPFECLDEALEACLLMRAH